MSRSVQNRTSFAWKFFFFSFHVRFVNSIKDINQKDARKIHISIISFINLNCIYDFRPYDGAVIHSIATFGEYLFPPGKYHKNLQSNALWGKGKWSYNYLIYISKLW